MDAVAVVADRSLPVALGDRRAMSALLEFLGDRIVAFSAGERHIEFEDRRLGILRVENLVSAVAVGADRSVLGAGSDSVPVDTLFVRGHHLSALPAVGHHELLTVARPAGRRNIGMMHARLWIGGRQKFVRTAVAVDAGSRVTITRMHCSAVEAAIVRSLLVGMASGATNLFGSGFVRRAFYIGVAVHTGEHAAVDGIFEGLRIDMQADGLAVDFMRECGIAMASETIICCRFRRFFLAGC